MPELPEVETVVRSLRPKVVSLILKDILIHRSDIIHVTGVDLVAKLRGRKISNVDRRAKRIVFTLDSSDRFYVHLGMTGQLTVTSPDTPVAAHTHVVWKLSDGQELRFRDPRRFGGVWWIGQPTSEDDDSESVGPEPLTLRPDRLIELLGKTKRAIKVALLDQKLIAGIGNIYADEALHAAGIHPLAVTNQLKPAQVLRLNRAIKSTLRKAIRNRGSRLRDYVDADGESGSYQLLHRVYDRANKPCHNCGTPIKRIVLGGRSTHFCSNCQKRK